MINKISDIQIGKEYFILFIKNRKFARKGIVEAIINDIQFKTKKTELYFSFYKKGKLNSTHLVYAEEIGIGETKNEAYKNYGKFNFEENESFSTSFEDVEIQINKKLGL